MKQEIVMLYCNVEEHDRDFIESLEGAVVTQEAMDDKIIQYASLTLFTQMLNDTDSHCCDINVDNSWFAWAFMEIPNE